MPIVPALAALRRSILLLVGSGFGLRLDHWPGAQPAAGRISANARKKPLLKGGQMLDQLLSLLRGTACLVLACVSLSLAQSNSDDPSSSAVPRFGHVFIVVEENHSFSSVIGSPDMPYLNSLANQYGLATSYFADTHPSIGNYFMLTTGQIVTNDDDFTDTVTDDNMVRQLLAAGVTWKSYAEDLPWVGYTDGDMYPYFKHHNPFTYFSDVLNSPDQLNNLVPFSQFSTDLANNTLPQFSFIVPNVLDDAHDGSLADADSWLRTNIDPLIQSPLFQQDGLLVIVFDESFDTDTQNGGGQVAMVVVSPKAIPGYQSTDFYQHESTLRLLAQGCGLTHFPGAADTAPDMFEFFKGSDAPVGALVNGAAPDPTASRTAAPATLVPKQQ